MAIRNIAIPMLTGGAMLLGYAAFLWLRGQRAARARNGGTQLREAGLTKPGSELARQVPEFSELELDLDFADAVPAERPAHRHELRGARIGALFLARATEALSPFGADHGHFDLDQLDPRDGVPDEATPRTRSGIQSLAPAGDDDAIPATERRPSVGGARS